jgi:hypothetical protein
MKLIKQLLNEKKDEKEIINSEVEKILNSMGEL